MTASKIVLNAASGVGGAGLDVDEVFSTYLWEGVQLDDTDIVNGIDLSGEGGMVWIKDRSTTYHPYLYDTERGVTKQISSAQTNPEGADLDSITAFNSNGFTIGNDIELNTSGNDYVSWTFRKAPKFFDVVTYTGDGTTSRTISHNLGSVPGMIIVKQYQAGEARPWSIYHRGIDSSAPEDYRIHFTTAARVDDAGQWNDTAPTSSVFTVGGSTYVNNNGESYVAYLFAHNDGDGNFGPDADADAIKCGSFTTNANGDAAINLGFEPQWVLLKRTDAAQSWWLADTMRGMTVGTTGTAYLLPDQISPEDSTYGNYINPTSTGFGVDAFSGSASYIYMAIRRGSLAPPEAATDVFNVVSRTANEPGYKSGFVTDMYFYRRSDATVNTLISDRLRQGKVSYTNLSDAEGAAVNTQFDYMNGADSNNGNFSTLYGWMWKRAPNYFDVVAYTGDGSPNNHAPTLTHNLGAVPEMLWVKKRSGTSNWAVVVKSGTGGVQAYLDLNNGNVGTLATTGPSNTWSDYFTSTQVIGDGGSGSAFHSPFPVTNLNVSGSTYIMYLFATLDGISKVGSYSGNGSTQTIDCGFSAGARFVLIKRTNGSGSWLIFDTERGIVSGNDPYLELNETGSQNSTTDYMDPDNSGFALTQNGLINAVSGEYIFYAIA